MNKQSAFTLIELMIVVAIIGILASISYPNYRDYVLRSDKALAQTTLVEIGVSLERFFSENNSYEDVDTPFVFNSHVPANSSDTTHNITLAVTNSGASYTITATPVDSTQLVLTLDSSGLRKQGTTIGWDD